MAFYINKLRSQEPLFKKGDKVYLFRKNIITKQQLNKLDWKKFRAYEVLEQVLLVNYQLKLAKGMKIHLVFYISLLELVLADALLEKLKVVQDGTNIYNVETILDIRKISIGAGIEYIIK